MTPDNLIVFQFQDQGKQVTLIRRAYGPELSDTVHKIHNRMGVQLKGDPAFLALLRHGTPYRDLSTNLTIEKVE